MNSFIITKNLYLDNYLKKKNSFYMEKRNIISTEYYIINFPYNNIYLDYTNYFNFDAEIKKEDIYKYILNIKKILFEIIKNFKDKKKIIFKLDPIITYNNLLLINILYHYTQQPIVLYKKSKHFYSYIDLNISSLIEEDYNDQIYFYYYDIVQFELYNLLNGFAFNRIYLTCNSSISNENDYVYIYTDGSRSKYKNSLKIFHNNNLNLNIDKKELSDICVGSAGIILLNNSTQYKLILESYDSDITHNYAELKAIYNCLLYIYNIYIFKKILKKYILYSDSEYSIKSIIGEYNGIENLEIINLIKEIIHRIGKQYFELKHIHSHQQGNSKHIIMNNLVDNYAKLASLLPSFHN